jgi:hypothetical protein
LDAQNDISASESVEADTLTEATERALAMLKSRPHHRSIEIWQGARRLYPTETVSRLPEPANQKG